MYCIDFHTHLDWYSNEASLLEQLKDFEGMIVAASVDEESFKKNVLLKEKVQDLGYKARLFPTMGLHPQKVTSAKSNLSFYDEYCNASAIIGEIGMDFCWYKEATPQQQEHVFRYFLQHCNDNEKYCVIHTKDAELQIARILEEFPKAKPIIHWYDGPEDVFQEFIHRGYYQTFGCDTIRSKAIQNLLKQTPTQLILAETDNPTAEPWLGGKDDSVNLIKRIYNDIGTVLGMKVEEISKIINENSLRVLG